MGNSIIPAIILLAVAIIISRLLSIRSMGTLTDDQRLAYFQTFNKLRKYQVISLLVLIAMLFIAVRIYPGHPRLLIEVYFVLFAVYTLWRSLFMWQNLKPFNMPPSFIRMHWISLLIQIAGLIGFAIWVDMLFGAA